MKWLKLFEGFREDFYKSVDDLQTEYKSNLKKLFSDSKVKVNYLQILNFFKKLIFYFILLIYN